MFRRFKAKFSVKRLRSHEYYKVSAIGDALYESLYKISSEEEKKIISLIEQRRKFLLKSKQKINVLDYGAGSPDSNRTKAQMKRGEESIECVADICKASSPRFWATFLFKLVRKLKPLTCVELGTCFGLSAAYQAAALKINNNGYLYTIEGSPEIAKIAKETVDKLNIENVSIIIGPFFSTLGSVLNTAQPIDLFFNDGHHDRNAVIQYFEEAFQYLSNEAVIIFDDISWSEGMRAAWEEIKKDDRVIATVDLHMMGIAVVGKNMIAKQNFKIPLL